jgi:hypothetical protein
MQTYLSTANIAIASPIAMSVNSCIDEPQALQALLCGFTEWGTTFSFALPRLDANKSEGFVINHPMEDKKLLLSMQPITGEPSAMNRIIDGKKIGQGVLDLLMASAFHHLKYKQKSGDPSWINGDVKWFDHVVMYYGVISMSSVVLGLNYDNPYSKAFSQMVDAKGADFSGEVRDEVVRVISPILPNSGKLFVVVPEACTLDGWGESVFGDGETTAPKAEIWSSLCMDEDSGWGPSEVRCFSALEVGDGLLDYGDFRHAIIRIR